jgi:hypothetical protein
VKPKQPHGSAMTLGNVMTEPDLLEHQRLINRALTQNAARHLARSAQNAGASIWPLVVVATVVLSIAAGLALLVFLQ